MEVVSAELRWETVVFVSPIPALMVILAGVKGGVDRIYAMHNDKREAKEIRQPDGSIRIIHIVAKEGWVLV